MTIYFCDIEANGFLEDATKVHCLSHTADDGFGTHTGDKCRWFFEGIIQDNDTLVWHNGFGYDLPLLEKLGIISGYNVSENEVYIDNKVKHVQLIDSLALSRDYWPDNPRGHGLEAWAKYLGTYKPHIDDWHNLPIEDYIERCEEDVITTEKVFEFLCDKLGVEL